MQEASVANKASLQLVNQNLPSPSAQTNAWSALNDSGSSSSSRELPRGGAAVNGASQPIVPPACKLLCYVCVPSISYVELQRWY